MPWSVERTDGGPRLTLTGHVDIFEAADLHEVLVDLGRGAAAVHLDFSGCVDLDSSALQLLLAFCRAREAEGVGVFLTGAIGRAERLLVRFRLLPTPAAASSPG